MIQSKLEALHLAYAIRKNVSERDTIGFGFNSDCMK